MTKIDVRRGIDRTSIAISDEHHALLVRLAKERGERTPARLLDAPLARVPSRPRGRLRRTAEAWIAAQVAPQSSHLDAMTETELRVYAARLEGLMESLERKVTAGSAHAAAAYRTVLLAALTTPAAPPA